MRRKLSIFCTFLILFTSLTLAGCSGARSSRQEDSGFTRFTEALFEQEVSSNTITLHYTLQDPSRYGISEPAVSLGSYTADPSGFSASIENCLAALHQFSYEKLSHKNKLTYDILENHLQTCLDGIPYTLYEEPLTPLTGTQAQLPVLLSEYRFGSAGDVETYLDLLEEVPGYFHSLAEFERQKSESGLFMAPATADSIIEECDTFLQMGKKHYLYSSFPQRLENLTDLEAEQKEAYIRENESRVTESVFPAYRELKETLLELRKSSGNPYGLCYLPDGAAYYEFLVRQKTGSDRSIPELKKLTQKQIAGDLAAMQEAMDPSGYGESLKETASLTLENSDPSSILQELKTKIQNSFPALPEVNTEIKYVQEEMEEYLSPAFYMVPAIDNASENVIYINRKHLPDDVELFTTLAHEGYPGHLYQTVYFSGTDPDPIRGILNFGGYTEGWATYSEMLSYYFTSLPKETAAVLQRNTSVILGLYALADIGIHYEGWKLMDTVSFFRQYGISDADTIENIYSLIIADPANYLKYYIGYIEFLELKKDAMEKWGEDFSQKTFHKTVLDIGPAPFSILRKYTLENAG